MKTLYTFKVSVLKEKEVPHESVDEKGQKTITYSKEIVPEEKEYSIKKPSRDLRDDADFFHAKEKSRLIKGGILTQAQLSKQISDGGGIISEKENEFINKKLDSLRELDDKWKDLVDKKEKAQTEEEKNKISTELNIVESDILRGKGDLQDFYLRQYDMFNDTVEHKARVKALTWWIVNLSYSKNGDKFTPFFKGESYEDKMDSYDEKIEEGSEFDKLACSKFAHLIGYWFSNQVFTEAAFKDIDEKWEKLNKLDS